MGEIREKLIVEQLASVVKARRKTLGMTQEELAHALNIDRTYASQIERAIANPSLSVLCSLATDLDLTFVQLVGEAEVKTSDS